MVEAVIAGAEIIDGTDAPRYRADLAIEDGLVSVLEGLERPSAQRVINADGLVIAPGFIDVHSHNDLVAVTSAELNDKVTQGVTTEVFGNCGFSAFPVSGLNAHLVPQLIDLIAPQKLELAQRIGWPSWTEFAAAVKAAGCHANVVGQVGHIMLRSAAMGMALRKPDSRELATMKTLLAQCLQEGASGLSFGLMYHPSSFADDYEIRALCQVAADYGAFVSVHLRGYDAAGLVPGMRELLRVAEATGVRLQLSHLSPTGRDAQDLTDEMLAMVEDARTRGIDVALDRYPYEQGMSKLALIFPNWVLAGGAPDMIGRLSDPAEITRMVPEIDRFVRPIGYERIEFVRNCEPSLIGKTIEETSRLFGLPPAEMAAKVLHDSNGQAGIILTLSTMQTQEKVIKHCLCMVGSDGMPSLEGTHPRTFGTFPRVIGPFVRKGLLTLEEAVHKMTGLPANRFGLTGRGRISTGSIADLVVFDPATIGDMSSFDDPYARAHGIQEVFVAGRPVYRGGEVLSERPGQVLTCRVPRRSGL